MSLLKECGLKSETLEKIIPLFKKFPEIEIVVLYGSRAKGTYKNGSDIDLTFKGKNLTLAMLNKIAIELDDLLLPYTFDISLYEKINNPELLAHINRVGIIFYQRNAN